jgi:hypothetical protein
MRACTTRARATTQGIEAWWTRYLADPEFRLAEEIPAHRAEYKTFCSRVRDYQARMRFGRAIAERLGGPLYGGLITPAEARKRITS